MLASGSSEVYLNHLTSVEKTDKLVTTIKPKFKSTKHNILYFTLAVTTFRHLQSCNIYISKEPVSFLEPH